MIAIKENTKNKHGKLITRVLVALDAGYKCKHR